jgi:predicted phage-related endonuclease
MVRLIQKENLQDWHNYRNTGLGASEAPTLLGYNPFISKLELWHRKIGLVGKPFMNRKMLRGKATENFTSDCFKAWDGVEENHALNMEAKKYFRHCEKFPEYAYIVNDDVPHLFVSPDRKIIDKALGDGSLEIKDTSSMYLNSFVDKISPAHGIQIKSQLMVGEFNYGVLAYIIDGANEYKEYNYKRDGIIFNDVKNNLVITECDLKERVAEFWESVLMARDLRNKIGQAKLDFNLQKANEYEAVLQQLEPEPDSTLAYETYVKETFYTLSKPHIEIQGTVEHEVIAENYLMAKEKLDESKEHFQKQKNTVLNICKTGHQINLGKNKFIKVDTTSKGISVKVKF